MRSVWLVCLIAGCGFSGPGTSDDESGDPGGASGGSGTGTATASCDVQVPSLRLCVTFDHNVVQDVLQPPHHLAVASGVLPILRILSDAVKLDRGSQIRFDPSADFDMHDLTVDMWIDPDHGAQTGSFTMLDNDQQYTVTYEQDQHVQCSVGGQTVRSANTVGPGWHHVACRYEASTDNIRVYLDGDVAGCGSGPGGIPTGGTTGLTIGASFDGSSYQNHFIGSMDTLHLYGSVLSDTAICNAAGHGSCSAKCPGGGDDGHGGRG